MLFFASILKQALSKESELKTEHSGPEAQSRNCEESSGGDHEVKLETGECGRRNGSEKEES